MAEPEAPEAAEDQYSKPGFDGRLHYYKIVGGFMRGIAQASIDNNYDVWFNLLNCMFDLVSPFIRDSKEIETLLTTVENKVYNSNNCSNQSNQNVLNRNLERELHKVTRKLYQSAKHMLLPISDETNTEYSSEEFFRGSDL